MLAAIFGDVAATGRQALAALHGMTRHADGSIWRGPAADAFGVHLAQTPGQLQQMITSYETASQAMGAFGTTLTGLQDRAASAAAAAADRPGRGRLGPGGSRRGTRRSPDQRRGRPGRPGPGAARGPAGRRR